MKKIYTTLVIALISINTFAQAPNWLWAKSGVGNYDDEGKAISTDAVGNVFITGYFASPPLTFGTTTLTNAGNYDIFIVKYDATGNVLWAKSAGGTGDDRGLAISTDTGGNVVITGYFSSPTLTIGTTTLTNAGSNDIFIAKYDASGNVLWAKSAGGSIGDEGLGISTDAVGNVFITGYFASPPLTFGTTTLTNAGNYDIFIVKYDATGNVLWAKSAGGTGDDRGLAISTDAGGNVAITGYFKSPTLTFGTTTLTNAGSADIFIAKYDASGNMLWAKSAGGTSDDDGYGISTDAGGNVLITGFFASSTLTFGTTTLTNAGGYDIFIVKYDSLGNVLWAKSAGGVDGAEGCGISTDAGGNAVITGIFFGTPITFGTTTLTNAGGWDVFIAKYDASGNVLWAKSAGGTNYDYGFGISTDAGGNVFITGFFGSPTITFGTTTLTNAGSNDIFIAKLNNTTVGIMETEVANAVTIYPNPFTSQTTISFNQEQHVSAGSAGSLTTSSTTEHTIKITDVLGKEIKTINFTGTQCVLEKGEMERGIYFVQIIDGSASSPTENKNVVNRKVVVE